MTYTPECFLEEGSLETLLIQRPYDVYNLTYSHLAVVTCVLPSATQSTFLPAIFLSTSQLIDHFQNPSAMPPPPLC